MFSIEYNNKVLINNMTDTLTINTGSAKYYLSMNDKYRLGEGAFGVVYKAKDQSGNPVAIKIFKSSKDFKTVIETLGTAGNTIGREIFAYKSLGHLPNVVKYIDSALINDTGMVIMEYCNGGSLSGKKFESKICLEYLAQMANGIHKIHQKGIIHRDLKPDNVMISNGVIKIGDLGLASKKLINYEYCGTKLYMAPEVRNKQAYSQSADIYSLGLIFVAILTGRNPPYSSSSYKSFGKEIFSLINQMLDMRPENRPKAEDIITMANDIINYSSSKSGLIISPYDDYPTETPKYEILKKSEYGHSHSGLSLPTTLIGMSPTPIKPTMLIGMSPTPIVPIKLMGMPPTLSGPSKEMKKPVYKPTFYKTSHPSYEHEEITEEEKAYKPIYEPPKEKLEPPEIKPKGPEEKYKDLTGGQLYNLFVAKKGLGVYVNPTKKWKDGEFKNYMLAKFKEHGIY